MAHSIKNKTVVVIGGANGIGYETANHFLEQEANRVIILDIDESKGNEAVKTFTEKYGEGKAIFIKCDVTTDLEVFEVIKEKYKTVNVLVLSAGLPCAIEPKSSIDVFVTAVIEWSLTFLEFMSKEHGGNGGSIIIVSSIFGFKTIPFFPIYQATKFAVLGFAKSLGHEHNFNKTGVRVIALCPGFTKTNIILPLYHPELKKACPDQDFIRFVDTHEWQDADVVGDAAVKVFKRAETGTVWVIEGGKLTEKS